MANKLPAGVGEVAMGKFVKARLLGHIKKLKVKVPSSSFNTLHLHLNIVGASESNKPDVMILRGATTFGKESFH